MILPNLCAPVPIRFAVAPAADDRPVGQNAVVTGQGTPGR